MIALILTGVLISSVAADNHKFPGGGTLDNFQELQTENLGELQPRTRNNHSPGGTIDNFQELPAVNLGQLQPIPRDIQTTAGTIDYLKELQAVNLDKLKALIGASHQSLLAHVLTDTGKLFPHTFNPNSIKHPGLIIGIMAEFNNHVASNLEEASDVKPVVKN